MINWFESPKVDEGVVISSRIRFARNLKAYPFPSKLVKDVAKAKELTDLVVSSVKRNDSQTDIGFNLILLDGTNSPFELSLLEKHCISPEFFKTQGTRTLLLSSNYETAIMINEEDHIRLQTIFPSENLDEAFYLADSIDNFIEESLEFAFDKDYGYLTSCPTNTGSGMRASYMLHLPVLESKGKLRALFSSMAKLGITARGMHGEGSESFGSIYQVSNQLTMSKSERDIVAVLKNVTGKLIEQENRLRIKLHQDNPVLIEDRVNRAYGVLKYAKSLDVAEAMSLLSEVRTGFLLGVVDAKKPDKTIYNLMIEIQNGSLINNCGKNLTINELDIERANVIRMSL